MSGSRRPRHGGGIDNQGPNAAATPPTPDGATFRDLLIFEERLKQNAARLLRRKRKYQTLLALLSAAILFLSYHVLLIPKAHPLVHYAQLALLVVCCTTVFLFFASGMYAERIVAANRFVPQANRALRPFNMYLNTRRPPRRRTWLSSLPFIGGDSLEVASLPSASSHPGSSPSSPSAKSGGILPSSTGSASPGSTFHPSGTRLVRASTPDPANPNGPPPVRRMQINPIPPSSNPRGEIIFSNKVAPAFREGYERYRNAFERRRKEKLDAAESKSKWRWAPLLRPFALLFGAAANPVRTGPHAAEAGEGIPMREKSPSVSRGQYSQGSLGRGGSSTPVDGSIAPGTGSRRSVDRTAMAHRSRSDSGASNASASSHGSTNASGETSSTRRGSRASPRLRPRDLPPGSGSSSGAGQPIAEGAEEGDGRGAPSGTRRVSQQGQQRRRRSPPRQTPGQGGETAQRTPSERLPQPQPQRRPQRPPQAELGADPDPQAVAANADERADSKSTLREPEPEAGSGLESIEESQPVASMGVAALTRGEGPSASGSAQSQAKSKDRAKGKGKATADSAESEQSEVEDVLQAQTQPGDDGTSLRSSGKASASCDHVASSSPSSPSSSAAAEAKTEERGDDADADHQASSEEEEEGSLSSLSASSASIELPAPSGTSDDVAYQSSGAAADRDPATSTSSQGSKGLAAPGTEGGWIEVRRTGSHRRRTGGPSTPEV